MSVASTPSPAGDSTSSELRWGIAVLISAAIAISYLDRQTLPWAIKAVQADIPITNEQNGFLNSAFLVMYGLMYLGGGWLLDRVGTRRGFLLVMICWSLACASHGLVGSVLALGACRLLLGMGEGGGFPAATRAVAEWFPPWERATAMGIINGGTAVGAVAAPPLIAWVLLHANWLHVAPWRWMFFLTGSLGLIWAAWWWLRSSPPEKGPGMETPQPQDDSMERTPLPSPLPTSWGEGIGKSDGGNSGMINSGSLPPCPIPTGSAAIRLSELLRFREIWAVVGAKFLSDAAWYFYLFWLPKYLYDARHFDLKQAGSVGWIPYAASGIGCLCGGTLSSWLLRKGGSVNRSRKVALGVSAALMPWVMFVPSLPSVAAVITIFSIAFFGQQSWSTLIMVLPTDLVPQEAVGKVAGLVGLGGAMGGVLMNLLAGYLLDHGYSYTPVLCIAASLHVAAFILICAIIPVLQPLPLFRKMLLT